MNCRRKKPFAKLWPSFQKKDAWSACSRLPIPSRPASRALLGAIAEEIGKNATARARLRASLNPLSRFDFGLLAGLFARQDLAGQEEKLK